MIYLCSGTDSEKLEWFETINIAGEKLTDQELRNAVYAGSWVTDAKRYFSKTGCPAYSIGSDYMTGTPIRQDYLETVIKWINDGDIEGCMARQQHKPQATDLWLYFQKVIAWVEATFPEYRREMKGISWGELYNEFKDAELDSAKLEEQVRGLMADEDVMRKKGIYSYVLNGQEKHLNIRAFSPNQRREAYERQGGICPVCGEHFEFEGMEADHITPWQNAYATTQLLGSEPRFVLSTSGHIAAMVNPPGNEKASFQTNDSNPEDAEQWLSAASKQRGTWWTDYAAWLGERSGEEKAAPRKLGDKRHEPLAAAPGTYVLKR